MRFAAVVALGTSMTVPAPALAAELDLFGNMSLFHTACLQFGPARAGYYAAGISDALEMLKDRDPRAPAFCIPAGVSVAELGETMCKYIARNRERHERAAPGDFLTAMTRAFPCGESAR